MPHTEPTPQVGEIVSALSRFAPQSLADIKARHPDKEILFRPGAVLGDTPISISCELALELLSRYSEAAAQIFKRIRRQLGASWWFDLVAKLAATGGATATIAAFYGGLSNNQGMVAGLVALVGSACGLIFSLLQRDEAGGSLPVAGFDTLSCFTCQWSQSAFVRDKEINDLPERCRGKMASSPPLLD